MAAAARLSDAVELSPESSAELAASPLYNADIAPTPLHRRTWNLWHIAALWIGMAVCIPTYMLAASLLASGMNWWQALLTITLGNLIVLVPMVLNAHGGTKYGIPFPVLLRSSFGIRGAHIPALLRALVACGWFGIQTWIGGHAVYHLAAVAWPNMKAAAPLPGIGINIWETFAFLLFWLINLWIVLKGSDSIRWLESWAAPALLVIGLALLGWGVYRGGGLGRILAVTNRFAEPTLSVTPWREGEGVQELRVRFNPVRDDQGRSRATRVRLSSGVNEGRASAAIEKGSWIPYEPELPYVVMRDLGSPDRSMVIAAQFSDDAGNRSRILTAKPSSPGHAGRTSFWLLFLPALTAMVGYWATLSLNILDFTRFARSQKDQVWGQILGLPTTMGFYSFVGIAATGAAVVIFPDILAVEDAPWDPVTLLSRFSNPLVVVISMFALAVATLTTNIAANVVSPANAFSNAAPRQISFRVGGLLTGFIGIAMMPWKLIETTQGYIFTWLIAYGALLGPIAGIMIADYYLVRRRQLHLDQLYREQGVYRYWRGYHLPALLVLLVAIAPSAPGFLAVVMPSLASKVAPFFQQIYTYSWFLGFAIALVLYPLVARPNRTELES
jgi:cytosine/uracil/thiamine/allantoin permease